MLKDIKWSSILSSLLYIAAGILFLVKPDTSAALIGKIIGIGFMVFATIRIVSYFLLDLRDSMFRNDLVSGFFCLMAGLLILTKPGLLSELFPIILGLVILSSGFVKLQNAVVARRIGYEASTAYMILALISILLGLAVIFFLSGEQFVSYLFIIIGIGLLYCGISDLYVTLVLNVKFKSFMKKTEEALRHTGPIDVDAKVVSKEPVDETNTEE